MSGVSTVAMFGDSITAGCCASAPGRSWTARFAAATDTIAIDRAIPGTVLQASHDASGAPRPDNGLTRAERDLLVEPADAICILYGYNDARYTAAPETFCCEAFERDFRLLIERLLAGGFAPNSIAAGSPPYIPDAGFSIGSSGFTGQSRAGFERYVTAVGAIAREYGLVYAPVYEVMAASPAGSLASSDTIHPGDEGHARIAHAFLDAVCHE
jgi:lysophospholipase L1-like esterase